MSDGMDLKHRRTFEQLPPDRLVDGVEMILGVHEFHAEILRVGASPHAALRVNGRRKIDKIHVAHE